MAFNNNNNRPNGMKAGNAGANRPMQQARQAQPARPAQNTTPNRPIQQARQENQAARQAQHQANQANRQAQHQANQANRQAQQQAAQVNRQAQQINQAARTQAQQVSRPVQPAVNVNTNRPNQPVSPRPMMMNVQYVKPDPYTNGEFCAMVQQCNDIKESLMNARQVARDDIAQQNAPKMSIVCPFCGAAIVPDKDGRCEYCGSVVEA